MKNFSQWVRMALRSYENGEDLATETMRRIKWAKVANIFAATIVEKSKDMDENYQGSIEELIDKAMKEVQKQTSLRDFEWLCSQCKSLVGVELKLQQEWINSNAGMEKILQPDLLKVVDIFGSVQIVGIKFAWIWMKWKWKNDDFCMFDVSKQYAFE